MKTVGLRREKRKEKEKKNPTNQEKIGRRETNRQQQQQTHIFLLGRSVVDNPCDMSKLVLLALVVMGTASGGGVVPAAYMVVRGFRGGQPEQCCGYSPGRFS
jgi:hypothetical protein